MYVCQWQACNKALKINERNIDTIMLKAQVCLEVRVTDRVHTHIKLTH